jgi:hypothetical protein
MVSLPNKRLGLLVPLSFAVYVVCDSFIHLAPLWTWRIAFARTFLQAFRLLSFRVRPSSVFASIALWVVFVHSLAPFAVAPFARWVARLETRRQGFSGLDGLQALALTAVEASLTVSFLSTIVLLYVVVKHRLIKFCSLEHLAHIYMVFLIVGYVHAVGSKT